LKKRTKIFALSAALASAAALTTTAPANGDTPQNFVRIDNQYTRTKKIAIADYDVTSGKVIRGQYVTFAKPFSAYWLILDSTAGWFTALDQQTVTIVRTPGSGTDLYQHLPVCYVITPRGQLRWAGGDRSGTQCGSDGAELQSW
jgi:hypothetical protein